jgi:NitT/TauT family transport system substrate-binding protein
MDSPLTVMQPFHSPFYAPLFVALRRGEFAREGLEVTVRTAPQSGGTIAALLEGTVEVSLGGLMRSLELADRGGPVLPHFAEVNSRNGFFLLAREPRPGFRWSDLVGKTVIGFAEAPTPWLCLLSVLRRHGVDPATVTVDRRLPVADAVAAFRAGRGDFLEQGQPAVEGVLAAGAAHLVASMGEATGPVPFSSFVTTRRFLADHREAIVRFTRAVHQAQIWMAEADGDAIATTIAPTFADVDAELLTRVVNRYRAQDTWARDPLVRRPAFDTLQRILLDGGFIQRAHRYEDLVDIEVATQVGKELGVAW